VDHNLKNLEQMDRQALLDYIESLEEKTASLEEKMEDLKAQVDVLNMDMDDFTIPDGEVPELHVSEQTADALAEAASIFNDLDDIEVEPAPVENGVVKLGPVTAEESYIPVAPAVKAAKKVTAKKAVKVKVKKKKA